MGLLMPIEPTSAMLVLMVSRSNLVKDTINQLEKHKPTDLKKPLKVTVLIRRRATIIIEFMWR